MDTIPARVREKLKFYVYLYVDPRDNCPFYVGKGRRNRVLSHMNDTADTEKVKRIEELRKLGLKPILEILRYGLTEQEAFLVESAAIDLLGVAELTNRVKGHGSRMNGRARLNDIVQELDAAEVVIKENAILINVSRLYRYGMSDLELYDATRGVWKVGPRRNRADFAFCVYGGIVREVYSIAAWVPACSTLSGRDYGENTYDERFEFVGRVAEGSVRKKYVGKSVRDYYGRGSQNPIKYANCRRG